MGTGNSKDGFVDILLQTNQPMYTAGTYVDGAVYINCKSSRNYKMLNIKLEGVEHVEWSQKTGDNKSHYKNTKHTYKAQFQLAVFANGVLPAGNYSFPFRFLLPSELPGSMFENQDCYIKYPLTAELVSSDKENDNQISMKFLNVLQPSREFIGAIQKQQIINPKCFGCCLDYGTVKVVMSCDKNLVKTGDKIQVAGYVDNTAGKSNISSAHISFQDIRWKIASSGLVRRQVMLDHPFYVIPGEIAQGEKKDFAFSATIPGGIMFSTAIGSIVARFQVLTFQSSMGCCAQDPFNEMLLVHHSATQKIEISPKVPAPPGWNPIVANQVLCTSLTPYNYAPCVGIPHMNRAGNSNTIRLNAMNTMNNPMNNTMNNTMNTLVTEQGYYSKSRGNNLVNELAYESRSKGVNQSGYNSRVRGMEQNTMTHMNERN